MIKKILLLTCVAVQSIYCLNGVVWNKNLEKFISIFDIPSFQQLRVKLLMQSYELETHNFNKQTVRLLFHQNREIISAYDNNRRVSGFFGEIYMFLSEYANFTLLLKSVPEKRVGIRPTMSSGYNGLLRYIEQNNSDIIAKIEIYSFWLDVVDFFLPLWNDRFRLFAQSSYQDNALWIVNLFTYNVWIAIFVTYALFISISIYTETYSSAQKISEYPENYWSQCIFYYHGVFTQRSFHILQMQKKSRLLNTCACVFSTLALSFYSAKILYFMVNKTPFQPFDSIESLHSKTDYMVISEKDSVIHLNYEFLLIYTDRDLNQPLRPLIRSKRIKFLPTRNSMYSIGCNSKRHYAMLESEYLKGKVDKYGCVFVPMGKAYFHTWIAGGVRKNFTYKRTLDRGILRLFESGLLNALKNRLIGLKKTDFQNTYEPINLDKINAILAVFVGGVIAAITLWTIEGMYYCLKHRKKIKKSKALRAVIRRKK